MIETAYPFTIDIHQPLDNILEILRKWGIAVVHNYVRPQELQALQGEFPRLLVHEASWVQQSDYSLGEASRVKRQGIERHLFPTTASIFEAPLMDKLARLYMGPDVEVNGDIFVVKDVVGSRHIANDLHFDVLKTFKFFIYLKDTTAVNGAFRCVPGSHAMTAMMRRWHGDSITYENRELTRQLPVTADKAIPIEGDAGTMIIFDTDVFHQAGTVLEGERWVMRGHCR